MIEKTTMSKKAAIAGMGITSIAASSDLNTQIIIASVVIVAVITQAWLDYTEEKK